MEFLQGRDNRIEFLGVQLRRDKNGQPWAHLSFSAPASSGNGLPADVEEAMDAMGRNASVQTTDLLTEVEHVNIELRAAPGVAPVLRIEDGALTRMQLRRQKEGGMALAFQVDQMLHSKAQAWILNHYATTVFATFENAQPSLHADPETQIEVRLDPGFFDGELDPERSAEPAAAGVARNAEPEKPKRSHHKKTDGKKAAKKAAPKPAKKKK